MCKGPGTGKNLVCWGDTFIEVVTDEIEKVDWYQIMLNSEVTGFFSESNARV